MSKIIELYTNCVCISYKNAPDSIVLIINRRIVLDLCISKDQNVRLALFLIKKKIFTSESQSKIVIKYSVETIEK